MKKYLNILDVEKLTMENCHKILQRTWEELSNIFSHFIFALSNLN
jgi:hypothetical protein